jgi:Bax protein
LRRKAISLLFGLESKHNSQVKLTEEEVNWLTDLGREYRLLKKKEQFHPGNFQSLIKRVDAIPVSMSLGQAAYESAYATSRFAGEGNALFGQWTWSGDGIKPSDADNDSTHKVMRFNFH